MLVFCTLSPSGENIDTILWTYLLDEVLTDIHALADYFSLFLLCA